MQCVREVLLLGHRQAFTWIDEWIEMTMDDVRKYESQLQQQTNTLLQQSVPNNADPPGTPDAVAGDLNPLTGSPPLTPKSPGKRGYFSWF